MSMKKCPKCGATFDASTRFCSLCGTPLREERGDRRKWIAAAAVLLMLAVLVAVFVWNHMKAQDDQTQAENTTAQSQETAAIPSTEAEDGGSFGSASQQTNSYGSSDTGDDYILPGSDTRYISAGEVASLTNWELRLARNEIFARRGRLFDDPSLASYFSSKSWYHGTILPEDFSEDGLSKIEKENIEVIKAEEARR